MIITDEQLKNWVYFNAVYTKNAELEVADADISTNKSKYNQWADLENLVNNYKKNDYSSAAEMHKEFLLVENGYSDKSAFPDDILERAFDKTEKELRTLDENDFLIYSTVTSIFYSKYAEQILFEKGITENNEQAERYQSIINDLDELTKEDIWRRSFDIQDMDYPNLQEHLDVHLEAWARAFSELSSGFDLKQQKTPPKKLLH